MWLGATVFGFQSDTFFKCTNFFNVDDNPMIWVEEVEILRG